MYGKKGLAHRAEVLKYSDWNETPTFNYEEMHEEEISCLAEGILEKPYRDWLAKEKTKIRYNFAEDAKRTWNRIKQTAGQATTIEPEILKDHYAKNWEDSPEELNIKDYSDFIMLRRLVFVESEMLRE
jgi:hypothetical protein